MVELIYNFRYVTCLDHGHECRPKLSTHHRNNISDQTSAMLGQFWSIYSFALEMFIKNGLKFGRRFLKASGFIVFIVELF